MSRLNIVDLPTFGRPTMTRVGKRSDIFNLWKSGEVGLIVADRDELGSGTER